MVKNNIAIVGSGFSSAIAQLYLDGSRYDVITIGASPQNNNFLAEYYGRRKSLEVNKFFSKTGHSYGSLNANQLSIKLHDRITFGGNSNIWGGFIDAKNINKTCLSVLTRNNIDLVKLSLKKTGSISNKHSLCQLISKNGEIFDAKNICKNKISGYLQSFEVNEKGVLLKILTSDNQSNIVNIIVDRLMLCIGPIQILDLLYRSGYLDEGSEITLSEFGYKLSLRITNNAYHFDVGSEIIRFSFFRAFLHFMGVQRNIKFLSFLNLIPLIYIDQEFQYKKNNSYLKIVDNKLIEVRSDSRNFGKSIHYCGLKINGCDLNEYLKKIHQGIFGAGMAFIDQQSPGPISNEIISDVLEKI